jgi:hypothetical protein
MDRMFRAQTTAFDNHYGAQAVSASTLGYEVKPEPTLLAQLTSYEARLHDLESRLIRTLEQFRGSPPVPMNASNGIAGSMPTPTVEILSRSIGACIESIEELSAELSNRIG